MLFSRFKAKSITARDKLYHAYTTEFDAEVSAKQLDSVLGPLTGRDQATLDEAWHSFQTGLLPWRTRALMIAAEASARIRYCRTADERSDTVISLLFDQSGSMRGQKMLFAVATADVAQEFLGTLGITCDVLGFTTSKWRGGRSRNRWKWRLRPRYPGRLNDLLHVVYKNADERRASTEHWDFRQMLRPDLPKENIDGEAILWAAKRLMARPERRKYLILLSDGAPVDDSTLTENGPTYLADHLELVVKEIAQIGEISLAAMGIGYRTHPFYPVSSYVEAPDELGASLIALIERLLISQGKSG